MEERARGGVAPAEAGTEAEALRAGIAGTGFVGRIHARSALLAGGRVTGVAASTPERSRRAAAELGADRSFANAEELAVADDVDVVHVCMPNHLHAPVAVAALEAGKHVILEKPVAVDSESAARIAAAADRAGTVVAVPFAYRYYPTVREARARVAAGTTGALRLLQGGYLQDWLLDATDDNWRVEAELGGASRAFADIGSHWCDLVEFVTGQRISRLHARIAIAHPKRSGESRHSFDRGGDGGPARPVETEDMALVMFETDAGAVGSTVVSQVSAGRKNRLWFEFAGEQQNLAFDGEQPETLWVGERSGVTVVPRDPDTLAESAAIYATLPGGHPQGYNDLFHAFIGEAYRAIRNGERADGMPMLADGLRAVAITEAVLASAREREWVEVPA